MILDHRAGCRAAGVSVSRDPSHLTDGAAGKTYFLYDDGVPVCELNSTGSVTATNTWGVDGLVSRTAGANNYFHGYDEQGNTAEVFNSSDSLITSTDNDAFGGSVSGLTNTVAGDPYAGFEGQDGYYQDAATGWYLLGHRFYSPSLGRFINRDPIGYAGGINLYGYADDNAINEADPSGFDPPDGGYDVPGGTFSGSFWDAGSNTAGATAWNEWVQGAANFVINVETIASMVPDNPAAELRVAELSAVDCTPKMRH